MAKPRSRRLKLDQKPAGHRLGRGTGSETSLAGVTSRASLCVAHVAEFSRSAQNLHKMLTKPVSHSRGGADIVSTHHHSASTTQATKRATQPSRSKKVASSKNSPALSGFSAALSKVTTAAKTASMPSPASTKHATQTTHSKTVAVTTAEKSPSHTTIHTRSHRT
jgi:hypothetical protein